MEKIRKVMEETDLSEDDILAMLELASEIGMQICFNECRFDLAVTSMHIHDVVVAVRREK